MALLEKYKERHGENSKKYKKAKSAIDVYGTPGEKNGVKILGSATLEYSGTTSVSPVRSKKTDANPTGQDIEITINAETFVSEDLVYTILHEGSHAADGAKWVASGFSDSANPTWFQTEFDAFMLGLDVAAANGETVAWFKIEQTEEDKQNPLTLWLPWRKVDLTSETDMERGVKHYLKWDKTYKLTPENKKKAF
ncbi:MAG: hypothetical protein J5I65_02515 [Aridibacter famidurans]|nr:hypothetical protein [Aridibacter famidurans]